ncbi:MAG: trypsin-like peptidase domain-containing protein [Planctomycetes bacterium]|nr:trypsin-like peptidase domain-containing protein [Planctomycetota bacterium]
MKHHSKTILCVTMLLIGTAIGANWDSLPFSRFVSADSAAGTIRSDRNKGESPAVNGFASGNRQLAQIAKRIIPSVVHIQSTRRTGSGRIFEETGSGVIVRSVKKSGTFVVTNFHVIDGSTKENISIHLHDGRVIQPTRIWYDQATDLAVMKISASNLTAAEWGDSDKVDMGHMVLAFGSPFGLSRSMTFGIISQKGRRSLQLGKRSKVLNQDFLQTDAAINPGNSGGPLVDLQGRVIGINTAIASNSGGNDGIGFSIPSNLVRHIVGQLLERGKVQRAYLGIKLDSSFDAKAARRLGLERAQGAHILQVYGNTPAAAAGLKVDDVIVLIDGRTVQDENHLINLVSLTPVGSRISVTIIRKGRRQSLQIRLADRADLERRSE